MFSFASARFKLKLPGSEFRAKMCTLRKAVVRKMDQEPRLSLSFVYSSSLVKERQFNFARKQDEQLKVVCERITGSIKKQGEKRIKKLSNKAATPSEVEALQKSLRELENVAVYLNGNKIDDDVENKIAFQNGAVLKIGDTEFLIEVNPPMVLRLSLPKNIMAGFPVYPRVELEFTQVPYSKFVWYRSERRQDPSTTKEEEDPEATGSNSKSKNTVDDMSELKWEQVGEGYTYTSSCDDVHRYLKIQCIPMAGGRTGSPVEAVSSVLVGSGPGPCPFEKRHGFTQNPTKAGRFRIMSYNILADLYADSDFSRNELFPSCPPYALAIDYRKQLLLKEIQGYNCDVMCMQEVDTKIFDNCLIPTLENLNYAGIFTNKAGKVAEGLACFYNKDKFSLVSQHDIVLSNALEHEPAFSDFLEVISRNEALKAKILERTTVLQVIVLESLDVPDRKLCIANTHLYFKPESDNIRLLQAGMCMRHVEQVIALESARDPKNSFALIVTGDFNSTPEFGVYQLMTTQFIPSDHPDWRSVPEEILETFSLNHPFSLTSACGTPPYTNYTMGFSGCLDYIFSDDSLLAVEEVVPLPSHEEVTQYTALPSVTMPSDHIALVCTLKWL